MPSSLCSYWSLVMGIGWYVVRLWFEYRNVILCQKVLYVVSLCIIVELCVIIIRIIFIIISFYFFYIIWSLKLLWLQFLTVILTMLQRPIFFRILIILFFFIRFSLCLLMRTIMILIYSLILVWGTFCSRNYFHYVVAILQLGMFKGIISLEKVSACSKRVAIVF